MKTFEESEKSKKTVQSMIESRPDDKTSSKKPAKGKENKPAQSRLSQLKTKKSNLMINVIKYTYYSYKH